MDLCCRVDLYFYPRFLNWLTAFCFRGVQMNLFCNIFIFWNLDLAFLELIEQIEPSGWGLWFDAHSAVVCDGIIGRKRSTKWSRLTGTLMSQWKPSRPDWFTASLNTHCAAETHLCFNAEWEECLTNMNIPPCKFGVPFLVVLAWANMRVSPSAKLVERCFCSICHVCVRWLINATPSINSMAKLRIYYVLVDNISQIHLMLTALIRPSPTKFAIFFNKKCIFRRQFFICLMMHKENGYLWMICKCVQTGVPSVLCRLHTAPCWQFCSPTTSVSLLLPSIRVCLYTHTHTNKDRKPIWLKLRREQRFPVEGLWQSSKSHSSRLFHTTHQPAQRCGFPIVSHDSLWNIVRERTTQWLCHWRGWDQVHDHSKMLAAHLEGSVAALQRRSRRRSRSVRLSTVRVIKGFAFSCRPIALAKPITECLISVTRMFFRLHLTHHPHSNPVLLFLPVCLLSPCFLFLSSDTFHLLPGQTSSFSFSGTVLYFSHHTLSTHSSSQQHSTIRQTANCMHRNMIFYVFPRPLTQRCLSGAWGSSDGHAVLCQPVLSVHPKALRCWSAHTEECVLDAVMSNKPALVRAFGRAAATVLSQSGYQQPRYQVCVGLLRKSSQECNNGMLLSACFQWALEEAGCADWSLFHQLFFKQKGERIQYSLIFIFGLFSLRRQA